MNNLTAIGLTQSPSRAPAFAEFQYGFVPQDTWKVTRKADRRLRCTVGFGHLPLTNSSAAPADFSEIIARPRAVILAGRSSRSHFCNCNFASTYPYAVGPRVGFADFGGPQDRRPRRHRPERLRPLGRVCPEKRQRHRRASPVAIAPAEFSTNAGTARRLHRYQNGLPNTVSIKWPDTSNPALGQANNAVVFAPSWADPNNRPLPRNAVQQSLFGGNHPLATIPGSRVRWQPGPSGCPRI